MINYKDLTPYQTQALRVMEDFTCGGIPCYDCPLYSQERDCGSIRAGYILEQYEKETKQ